MLAMPAPAAAQSVIDATTAEFQPSADHNATANDGTPLVNSYLLHIFATGSSIPSYSIDMGKPAPGADGVIRFVFTSRLTVPLVGGTIYEARVSAVGPGGSSASQISNTFASSAPCAPALSSVAASVGASATTGSVAVAAGTTCAWTTRANVTWLTVTSGASVTGASNVNYSVSANTASTSRSGTLTIAGQTFTGNQSGSSTTCAYTVTPSSLSVAAAGVSSTLSIATSTGCSWSASGMPSWITMSSTAQTGSGTLSYVITPNLGAARSVTLTVAGRQVTVAQSAAVVPAPSNVHIVGASEQ